ncbi:MAG TPA: nucleoside-diphosphate kinase, partial [Solirubrobacterales bacterium]|nr:nucleoside-diphosphate kinase [Solirubrobacterales bacterium]
MFFREAWEEWSAAWGTEAVEAAGAHAAMLFKPDGVAARMIDPAIEFLAEHGFTPAAAIAVDLDRGTTRWLWLYRFNVASVDRVRLHDLVNTAGPGLLLVLRDRHRGPGDIPATVRLTDLKGPSRPERRRPDQLRSRLGVSDRLINFVHTSDEPADLLRELAILVAPAARPALFAALAAGDPGAWSATRRQVEDALPPHSFDGDAAAGRIRAQAEAALAAGPA